MKMTKVIGDSALIMSVHSLGGNLQMQINNRSFFKYHCGISLINFVIGGMKHIAFGKLMLGAVKWEQ